MANSKLNQSAELDSAGDALRYSIPRSRSLTRLQPANNASTERLANDSQAHNMLGYIAPEGLAFQKPSPIIDFLQGETPLKCQAAFNARIFSIHENIL